MIVGRRAWVAGLLSVALAVAGWSWLRVRAAVAQTNQPGVTQPGQTNQPGMMGGSQSGTTQSGQSNQPGMMQGNQPGVTQSGQPMGNQQLSSQVWNNLKQHGVDVSSVATDTFNGTVVLSGAVPTQQQVQQAAQYAQQTPGVNQVVNRLVVPSASCNPQQISSQMWNNMKQQGVDVSKVATDVRDGTVYLSGVVPSQQQKQQAMTIAQQTPSINNVVDRLMVQSNVCPSGTANVPNASQLMSEFQGSNVNMRLQGSTLTLSGTVPTQQAKTTLGNAARQLPGVAQVNNNVQVSPSSTATG